MPTTRARAGTPPAARGDFARRLRALRVPRGFATARAFALALGIDENRYTRYERAEVEPDLALIRHICEVLGVTPNELLGPGALPVDGVAQADGAGPRSAGAAARKRRLRKPV